MSKFVLEDYFKMFEPNDQNRRYTEFFIKYVSDFVLNSEEFDIDEFSHLSDEVLLDSLTGYMDERNATSKKTASQYHGALNQLYKNLERHYHVKNNIFINGEFVPEFEKKYQFLLSYYTDANDNETASEEEYDELLKIINDFENMYSFDKAVEGIEMFYLNNTPNALSEFARIRSVCATRLVLEFGFKNEIISAVKINDIDLENALIKRGRFNLYMSLKLKNSLIKYFQIMVTI